jgi:hypothetical protein
VASRWPLRRRLAASTRASTSCGTRYSRARSCLFGLRSGGGCNPGVGPLRVIPEPGNLLACDRHHVVGRRVDDAIDLGGQPFERVALLFEVGIPIVDAADALDGVRQHAFGDIGGHLGAAHDDRAVRLRSCSPPLKLDLIGISATLGDQLTQPREDVGIEPVLEPIEIADRTVAGRGEKVRAAETVASNKKQKNSVA